MSSKTRFGFTLLELVVTMSIIAILAVIAVPAYSKYRVRAKVSFMYESASPAKLTVTTDYYNNGYSFAASDYTAGSKPFVTPQSSSAVTSIAIVNGIITVTGNSTELGGRAIVMIFTPSASNNEVNWSCAITAAYVSFAPQNCINTF